MRNILEDETMQHRLGFHDFPFNSLLSFVPLIKHWKRKINSEDRGESLLANEIVLRLDSALDFLAPVRDESLLDDHFDFVELIMSGLFPLALRKRQMAQAQAPFYLDGFYYTPRLEQFLKAKNLEFSINKDPEQVRASMIIRACCMILNTFYSQDVSFDDHYIFSAQPQYVDVARYYKTDFNTDFVEIKKLRSLLPLSNDQIYELISNLNNLDLWLEYLPPTHFEFHGLVTVQLIDVTEEEALSRLKHSLLQKDAVIVKESIMGLEQHLCSYFNLPSLRLGITVFDHPTSKVVPESKKLQHHLLNKQFTSLHGSAFKNSIYEKACEAKEVYIVENLEKILHPTVLEESLLEKGIRSIALIPLLRKNGDVFGIVELATAKAYQLNNFSVLKLKEIRPLFRTALWRSRMEINNEVGAIIRQQYTSIHPSVEWRFLEEAFRLLELRESEDDHVSAQPIVFKGIYPLFGQADIVSSTNNRNQAIQADFLDNFKQILRILKKARKLLPEFEELNDAIRMVKKERSRLDRDMSADVELRSLDVIRKRIHPFFKDLSKKHLRLQSVIEDYFNGLDRSLEMVYCRRKDYEESVAKINTAIISYLEEEEKRMQKMLPHYFERFRTDGVEYEIYIGQSLLRVGKFEKMQLETLRLWQLVSMCEITRKIEALQPQLALPLTTAQLILVHSIPLSISFRLDEKKFDVDGDYNIRYAILKKRIDKALIKGTDERLTQSGKVAIVYAQEKDREEYQKYFQYLIQKKYISGKVEDLELSKLQGVKGLKAFRLTVLTGE